MPANQLPEAPSPVLTFSTRTNCTSYPTCLACITTSQCICEGFQVQTLLVQGAPDLSTVMHLLCQIIKGLAISVQILLVASLTCKAEAYQLPFAILLIVHWQLVLQHKMSGNCMFAQDVHCQRTHTLIPTPC